MEEVESQKGITRFLLCPLSLLPYLHWCVPLPLLNHRTLIRAYRLKQPGLDAE